MIASQIRTQESGSVPLVLLAAIVLGGVIAILFSVVFSGQQSVRADRDFSQAVHAADAGIQQAYVEILQVDADDPSTEPDCVAGGDPCTGVLGDGTSFEWFYEQTGPAEYQLESRGFAGSESRLLTTTIAADTQFEADLTAVRTLDMRGNAPDPRITVATFCNAFFRGNVASNGLEGISRYGAWDPDACEISSTAPLPDNIESGEGPSKDDQTAFCRQGSLPAGVERVETLPAVLVRGVTYCALETRSTHTLSPLSDVTDGEREVKVNLYGEGFTGNIIRLQGNQHMNWPSPTPADHEATDLQIWIYSGDVWLTGSSRMAATITAPFSSCLFTGNNTSFKGAVFCEDIDVRGNFSPDDPARALRAGELNIQGIDEQTLGS